MGSTRGATTAIPGSVAKVASYTFEIAGPPATKGSARSFRSARSNRIVTVPDCRALKGWHRRAQLSALAGMRAAGATMIHKPRAVALDVVVYVRRPKLPAGPTPACRPDLDKYLRAVLDALMAVCYQDDGQVVTVTSTKAYGTPGVWVRVSEAG